MIIEFDICKINHDYFINSCIFYILWPLLLNIIKKYIYLKRNKNNLMMITEIKKCLHSFMESLFIFIHSGIVCTNISRCFYFTFLTRKGFFIVFGVLGNKKCENPLSVVFPHLDIKVNLFVCSLSCI